MLELSGAGALSTSRVYLTLLRPYVIDYKYGPGPGANPFKTSAVIGANNSFLIDEVRASNPRDTDIWWRDYWFKCRIQNVVAQDIEIVFKASDTEIAIECNFGQNINSFGRYATNYLALWEFEDE